MTSDGVGITGGDAGGELTGMPGDDEAGLTGELEDTTGGVDVGGVEAGGVEAGGVEAGGVEAGGVEAGGVDAGGVDPGGAGTNDDMVIVPVRGRELGD